MMDEKNYTALEQAILFEDESILVINKPAGWVVNRSHTYSDRTIQDWMLEKVPHLQPTEESSTQAVTTVNPVEDNNEDELEHPYGTPEEIFVARGGIVHRLDKDTSGVLLLAKNPESLRKLLLQFKERTTEKTYLALVHGKLTPEKGEIRLPISRATIDRKKFAVDPRGRESLTLFTVKEYFPNLPKGIYEKKGHPYQGFSLVEVQPKTGRTHQIRVHMATITHPLVGDPVYTPRKKYRVDVEWCPRIFLHAKAIQFAHPLSGERMTVEAPLPADLKTALTQISEVR